MRRMTLSVLNDAVAVSNTLLLLICTLSRNSKLLRLPPTLVFESVPAGLRVTAMVSSLYCTSSDAMN